MHHSELIYNDLKPENIMINQETGQVTLIDFGFASSYLDKDGRHISDSDTNETFLGNLLCASYDQMNFFKTTRRDDIIATFYLLVICLNNGQHVGKAKDISKLD